LTSENAAAARSEPVPAAGTLNALLERQIAAARDRAGAIDVELLLRAVSAHYDCIDAERRGMVRSMQLMSDEAEVLTREIREQNAADLQSILDNVKDAIVTLDESGHIETFNPTGERIFGYATEEVLGRTLALLLPEIDPGELGPGEYLRRLAAEVDDTHVDLAAHRTAGRTKSGNEIAVEIAVSKAKLNRRDGFIVCIRDITERERAEAAAATERKRAETAVFQAKERAQVTLQSIGDAVITTDAEGRIDSMNPVAESLTGWESREAQGRKIGEVLTVINDMTREPSESPLVRCLREGQVLGLSEHTVLVSKRGQEIAIQDSAAPIRDRAGNLIGAVMVFHDVSKERRLHRALHYQASHDALTGLINRREFENRLTAALEQAKQETQARHALLYLDLDQFKLVNDTCGHPAGDQLLKQITGMLQSRIRAGDTLARLGGDEFGILLHDCDLDQALRVAEPLRQAIRDFRFIWQDGVLAVGVSIGIVQITSETASVASLMSAADVACYTAKDSGRNRVELYNADDVPERHREMHWVSKLTRACDESSFELFYQPIVAIGGNADEREHFELVLRLRDESGAWVTPAEFIPAAERYNVMPSIDRWVVRQALDRMVYRSALGVEPFTIAVNLSGTSLNDERFLEYLIQELGKNGLPEGAMCFEITETAAISNLENVVHFMRELKTRGCRFALDDFGSGLSSFMYLKTLPVDYLKIDGQFVENVARDPIDRSMVEAIGQVGRAMGIRTIAERVESEEVLLELGRLGIAFAQGFHIAKPKPVKDFPYHR
jgi:diguanylate cyclase (GGDEF)-like protein/PAS domain S-box-containing protein